MKIGLRFSSLWRKFNKDHRSSKKAKNASHAARVKLWRTRKKLTYMKATSIRKLQQKDAPLSFSPLWTWNSPPTQYSYKRNEVRNPSAVYVYDEFIDWDPSREAFHGSHGRVLYRDLLKPIGWSYRPAVIGDTVSAQPLEPLQIDLPPIISRETSDEDMDVLDEAAKYTDFEDYAQLMRSPNPSNGLEIYSELPEAGSLLISDFSL